MECHMHTYHNLTPLKQPPIPHHPLLTSVIHPRVRPPGRAQLQLLAAGRDARHRLELGFELAQCPRWRDAALGGEVGGRIFRFGGAEVGVDDGDEEGDVG